MLVPHVRDVLCCGRGNPQTGCPRSPVLGPGLRSHPLLYDRMQHETDLTASEVRMNGQRLLFATTIFLASFLLFRVEPIAARQLLPVLGGSAAVWITCLVFFQTALLLGYLYAHGVARKTSWTGHIALLAFAALEALIWSYADI